MAKATFTVRLPPDLLRRLDERVEEERARLEPHLRHAVSRATVIEKAVREHIGSTIVLKTGG